MQSNRIFFIVLIFLSLFFSSCITNKKLTYLQHKGEPLDTITTLTPSAYKIQPYDNLFIRIVTPDPQLSAMFNTISSSAGYSAGFNEQGVDLVSYPVEADSTIMLPYAGMVKVAGLTISVATMEVEKALKTYIADASVTVKMVNNYVSIIGEVQRPGRYPIYKNQLNIFQTIALAGDLNEFSNRKNLQIIRQIPSGNIVKNFNLTDRSIMSSEFYYVMPNDVIYVQPIKGKFFQMNAFPYSMIITSLSTIATFLLFFNSYK